jgi:hypothetical protein
MAPEQHLGAPADARADQFAFCVALYRALLGQHPFDDENYSTLFRSVVGGHYRVPTGSFAPSQVLAALRRGLSTRAEQRHPSMQAVLEALGNTHQRRRWQLPVSIAVVAAVGLTAMFGLLQRKPRLAFEKPVNANPKRLTSTGDVAWIKPSHDGRWLVFARGREFVLRDLSGNSPDRILPYQPPNRYCEPSWNWTSDGLILEVDAKRTRIVSIDPSRPPVDFPLGGCSLFVGPTEVVSYFASRKEVMFWDMVTRTTRTCTVPGDFKWIYGIDARPRHDALLVSTFDDGTRRIRVISMSRNCDDVVEFASFPHPYVDHLASVGQEMRAQWGRSSTEVVVAMQSQAPAGARLFSLSTVPPHQLTPLLDLPSIHYFALGQSGTVYFVQRDASTQFWRRTPAGSLTRLTQGSIARRLAGLHPDGGILLLEMTPTGRAIRRMSIDGQSTTTLAEYDGTGFVPYYAAVSPAGTMGMIGTFKDAPAVSIVDKSGTSKFLDNSGQLSASELAWAGETLLVNIPGSRNFAVFEDGVRRSNDLVNDPELLRAYLPVGAPDGDTVAVHVVPRGATTIELWLVSLSTGQKKKLPAALSPVGWSYDGNWVYAVDGLTADRIYRVPTSGGPAEAWMELPGIGPYYGSVATPNGEAIVAFTTETSNVFSVLLP